jgi:hypothetical protein
MLPRPLVECGRGALVWTSVVFDQQLTNLLDGRSSASEQCGIIGTADRMVNDDERIVRITQYTSHQLGCTGELAGHDGRRGNALPLCCNGVMQTARRAAASIANTADDGVPVFHLTDNLRASGRAVIRFSAPDDIFHAEFRA